MLRIILPVKGTLSSESKKICERIGIKLIKNNRCLHVYDQRKDVEVSFMDHHDIANFISQGYADIGFTGRDLMYNADNIPYEALPLGFAYSEFRFLVSKDSTFQSINDFDGKKICTSYPNLVNRFLKKNNINSEIIHIRGASEVVIHLGIADVIADVVNTSISLHENGLKILGSPIIKSEAIVVINNEKKLQDLHIKQLITEIEEVLRERKYIKISFNVNKNIYKDIRNDYELENTIIKNYMKENVEIQCEVEYFYLKEMIKNLDNLCITNFVVVEDKSISLQNLNETSLEQELKK